MNKDDILERAEKFYGRVSGICQELHAAYSKDIDFGLLGRQWETADPLGKKTREGSKRLALTVNRLKQFIYQVVNDYKKAEITSKVLPHDTSEKDKKLAEIRRGIMRSLERKKGGLQAYQIAAKTMITAGLGGWRLNTRYVDPKSHDQEPYFIPIHDMANVFLDYELCQEPDYSDMYDCQIQEAYSPERFKTEFGKSVEKMAGGEEFVSGVWGSKAAPLVTEYWFKEEQKDTLCRLIPQASEFGFGKDEYKSELTRLGEEMGFDTDSLIAKDERTGKPIIRETTRCKVYCAKLAGKQVIGEVVEWPIDLIPVVIVTGRKVYNKGRLTIEGLIRQSHDAQMSYNYLKSNIAERIALAPKAPFEVAKESIDPKDKGRWETANVKNWPYLPYRAYTKDGKALPPPRRTDPISGDPALIEQERQSVDEIKASMGMYDASIGNKSNETSGRAIMARSAEADTGNYDFTESMVLGIKYSTKVLNKLIPKVYDTGRQVSMVGEDDKETVIVINQQLADGTEYNLAEGDFDIDIEAGPSSATKAADIRENLTAIVQAFPQSAMAVGPEWIRNSEMRNADKTADAFERMVNMQMPGMFPDKQNPNALPPQVQQQMAQMQAQIQQMGPQFQQLQQELQKVSLENQALKSGKQIEAARLQVDQFKADTERMKVQAEIGYKQGEMLLRADEANHAQLRDKADMALQAQGQRHTQQKDFATHNASMQMHGDKMRQDTQRIGLEADKAEKDRAAKISQQGKPTGGKPGNPPSSRRKNDDSVR